MNYNHLTEKEKATNFETFLHIEEVMKNLSTFKDELTKRMFTHDRSKLDYPEVDTFTKYTSKLKGMTYGSDEYKQCLEEMSPALKHHYANNKHHPEAWKHGIDDMDLVSIVEMFCDWQAAVKRHDDGNIRKSIEINRERFGISDQLCRIFENTVSLLEKS